MHSEDKRLTIAEQEMRTHYQQLSSIIKALQSVGSIQLANRQEGHARYHYIPQQGNLTTAVITGQNRVEYAIQLLVKPCDLYLSFLESWIIERVNRQVEKFVFDSFLLRFYIRQPQTDRIHQFARCEWTGVRRTISASKEYEHFFDGDGAGNPHLHVDPDELELVETNGDQQFASDSSNGEVVEFGPSMSAASFLDEIKTTRLVGPWLSRIHIPLRTRWHELTFPRGKEIRFMRPEDCPHQSAPTSTLQLCNWAEWSTRYVVAEVERAYSH